MSLPSARPGWRRWRQILAAAFVFLPFALLVAREWEFRPDTDLSDHVQYVEHARALLEGRPYTDTGYLYSPLASAFAPRAYPPGFPIALAAAFAVAGVSLATAKVVTLLFAVGLLGSSVVYFGRSRGFAIGLGVALMLSVSPLFVEHSIAVVSDLPFAALVWLLLVLADREGAFGPWRAAAITAVTVAAILFRPHGLALIPALGVWGLINLRRLGWKVLLPGSVVLVVTLIGRLIVGADSLRSFPAMSTLVRHLLVPDLRYHLSVFEAHLYPFPGNLANDVLHVFTVALMLVGLAEFVLRRPRALAVAFGITYTVVLAAMPGADPRFALPLFPLFVFGLLNGVRVAVNALFPARGAAASLGWAVVFAAMVTARTLATEPPLPHREDPSYRGLVDHVRHRVEAGEQLRIASFRPRALAFETGAKGMVLMRNRDPRSHLGEWCRLGITHIALGGSGIGPARSEWSRRAIQTRPEAFVTEFRNEGYELVRMDPGLADCGAP